MKISTFSFYSDKKTLTIDKIKFIKPTENFNRPRTGLWMAKNKIWYNFANDGFDDNSDYKKQIKHQYKVKVDMTDIFLLTLDNFQDFFKLYKKTHHNINWKKFIKENPKYKGIYLTFDPYDDKLFKNIKLPLGPKVNFENVFKNIIKNNTIFKSKKDILDAKQIFYEFHKFSPKYLPSDVEMFVVSWLIPSICVWDKSAILNFKLANKNN